MRLSVTACTKIEKSRSQTLDVGKINLLSKQFSSVSKLIRRSFNALSARDKVEKSTSELLGRVTLSFTTAYNSVANNS